MVKQRRNKQIDKKYYLDTSNLSIEETVCEIESNNSYIF